MKICIIGGGWVGCHLAFKLKTTHDVVLFEKNNNVFNETSFKNQNRLHLGYHYARNSKTRELCFNTFEKFLNEYNFCINNLTKNYYCIPNNNSLIDFNTYLKIFNNYNFKIIKNDFLINVEGIINTNEKHINFKICSEFFKKELNKIIINKYIDKKQLNSLKNKYDLIIDATNNHLGLNNNKNNYFELTLSLIYKKIKDIPFDALTFVDGELFSLYPYIDDLYTLTDVKETPLKKFKSIRKLNNYKNKLSIEDIKNKINLFEIHIKEYFPKFNEYFIFSDYFLSTKTKVISNSDTRYPIINEYDNIVSCFTGKIQGIYIIEDYINNKIKNESFNR